MSNYDLRSNLMDELAYSVATAIDKFVVNVLTADATTTYSTAVGGFAAANVNTTISNLASKVMGYSEAYKGMFLIIEQGDVPGIMNAQMSNGFSYADSALNNGFMQSYGGVDIYVVKTGTFASATLGTRTFTNSGHRVFGIKHVATYASPRSIQYEEKGVSGKTGSEIVAVALVGAKVWTQKAPLLVNITLN
jgi:hypothetical protein